MPIIGVEQPGILPISPSLRLRAYYGVINFALPWYQDPEFLLMIDGPRWERYTLSALMDAFEYQEQQGEVYLIEWKIKDYFEPVGDVTYSSFDLPIALWNPTHRGKGIGKQVILTLLDRGRSLGYTTQQVKEIYHYNTASQRLFTSCGFTKDQPTLHGHSYHREL